MQDKLNNITIGLAGMLQAVTLLRELTQSGKVNEAAYESSIQSVFHVEAKTAVEVFGGLSGVKLGLEKILHTFDVQHTTDRLQNRYLLSLIHVTKKIIALP